jgi:hypothetical protein
LENGAAGEIAASPVDMSNRPAVMPLLVSDSRQHKAKSRVSSIFRRTFAGLSLLAAMSNAKVAHPERCPNQFETLFSNEFSNLEREIKTSGETL